MPVVTPSSSYEVPELEDHEAYKGRVMAFEIVENEYKGKRQTRLQIDFAVTEDDNDTIRDWVPIAFGVSRDTGQVSKLRTLLNALCDKPKTTEIAWFNTDTFEWGYTPHTERTPADTMRLETGMEVIFRGENGPKQDGSGNRYKIGTYQSAHERPKVVNGSGGRRAAPVPAKVGNLSGETAGASADDEDIPF